MQIAEQIICWLFAIGFLLLAFRSIHKDKWGHAGTYATLAAFFLFCGLGWVQGLAKTWVVSNVNAKLKSLGDQIDNVHKTTGEMHGQLSDHQKQIDEHQKELEALQAKLRNAQSNIVAQQDNITNQYEQIHTMQNALACTETNLSNQEKKLEDVTGIINNIYSLMELDTLSGSTSNSVAFEQLDAKTTTVFFRLRASPYLHSMNAVSHSPGTPSSPIIGFEQFGNIVMTHFNDVPIDKLRETIFSFQYLRDQRETNVFKTLQTINNRVFTDNGTWIRSGADVGK